MDIISYSMAKKYSNMVALGLASATVDDVNKSITFTLASDGSQHTIHFNQPSDGQDGISVTGISDKGNGVFTLLLSDGSETDPIQTVKGQKGDKGDKLTFNDLTDEEKASLKGSDGFSPTITENADNTDKIYKLDITTADSTFTTPNLRGKDGQGGTGSGEENVIESIKVNGVVQTVADDKSVDITVPTVDVDKNYVDTELAKKANVSDIPSLDGYAKTSEIPSKVSQLENDSNYLSSIPEEYVTETELSAKGYLTEHQDISGKVDKVEGKSLISDAEITRLASVDNYDDTDIKAEIAKKADVTAIPGKVSDLENDNKYQTESDVTTTLSDYATKTYVGEQIANAEHLKREIVTVLPSDTEASDNIIYMLKVESTVGNDKYQEYMKIDGTVQMVGDTSVDLTDSAKSVDIPTTVAELTDSADYAKKTDLHSHENKTVLDGITEEKVTAWDNKSDFSGSYNDLNDKPTIDAELSNTSENAIQNKVVTEEINKLYSDISFNDFDTATDGISFTDAEDGNMLVTNATRNLLNPTLETTTQDGVTCTNNGDGTYTLNGTPPTGSGYSSFQLSQGIQKNIYGGCLFTGTPLPANEYRLYVGYYNEKGNWRAEQFVGNKGIIIDGSYPRISIEILCNKGASAANNLIFKPMITTDLSATYDDFVPYSGYDVKTCGKNLVDVNTFPSSQVLNGITFTTDKKAGTITLNGTATKDFNNHLFNFIVVNGIKEYSFGGWDNSKIEVIHDNLGLFSDDEFNFDGLRNITNINANKKHAINCVYRQGQVFDNFVIKPYVSANYNTYDGYDNIKPYQDGGTVHIDSTTEFPLLGLKSFDGETNILSPGNVEVTYAKSDSGAAILDMSENKLDKDNVVNNQTTTVEGFALDARQANPNIDGSLAKQISDLNGSLDNLVPVIDNCDLVTTHLAISNNALNNPYLSGVVSGAYALILTVWTPTPQPFNQQIAFVAGGDEIALRSCGGDGKWGAWKKINVN